MVGVPRSNGCATCRKRSIKCDEIRPACSRCRRGSRNCPGYVRPMKFIDEGVRVRSRCAQVVPSQNLDISSPSHSTIQRAQLVANFVEDLYPLGPGPIQHSFLGGWLWLVPSAMHEHCTLDLAAESLASVYFAKKSQSTAVLVRGYEAYSRALPQLSRALQNPKHRSSLETLCATLLLVHYEVSGFQNRRSSLKLCLEVLFRKGFVMDFACPWCGPSNRHARSRAVRNACRHLPT